MDTEACPRPQALAPGLPHHLRDHSLTCRSSGGVAGSAQLPHGVVSQTAWCADLLRHKANFLKLLISEVGPRVERSGVGLGWGGRADEPAPTPISPTAAPASARGPTAPPRTSRSTAPSACPPCRSTSGRLHQEAAAVPGERRSGGRGRRGRRQPRPDCRAALGAPPPSAGPPRSPAPTPGHPLRAPPPTAAPPWAPRLPTAGPTRSPAP